jgi:hypothetical protein
VPAVLGVGLAVGLALHAPGAPAASRGRVEPGFGVTPGGLVWVVEPASRRVVLFDPDGSNRGAFPLAPDEGHVLGVADSGNRVTAPTPDGFRRRPARSGDERRVEARYVFRFADGSVRATVATTALRGSEPAFRGDEAWILRREGGSWQVVRIAPEGETKGGSVPEASVKRRVGRPSAPQIFAGTEGVAVLFPGTRGDAAARLDRPGVLFAPSPLEACGEGRSRLVLPHPDGVLFVSVRTAPAAGEEDDGRPLAVAEVVDGEGRLARSVPLGPWSEVLPLPDGGLLGLDGREVARFDERFAEISRAVLPLEEGSDPAAAARVVLELHRLEALGSRATGADWAELALLPGAPASRYLDRARNDPAGALARLAGVPDGGTEAIGAARALPLLLEALRPGDRRALLDRLRQAVEEGGPAWLRRSTAFALVAASPGDAPAWALPAVAEAIAAGASDEGFPLPEEAFTLELAELVTAVDRARIERIARERPEVAEGLLAGSLDDALSGSFDELRFHAPAGRFARTLLDCTAGPPSAAGFLALGRVVDAVLEASPSPSALARGEAVPEPRGALAETLLAAQGSPDAGLRASALAVGPLVGLPLDAARFRADVLRRPHLAAFAFLGLLADRDLPERAWMGLFTDLFFGARSASRDPSACTLSGWPVLQAEGEGNLDRYCNLFAIVHFAALDLGDEEDPSFVSGARVGLLRDFARSGSAPPELRLELKLNRAMRGTAPEEDVLEVLGERDLAPVFRRIVLGKLHAGSPRVAAHLERELSSGRVAAAERGAFLDALSRLDPAAGDRVAADAWVRGSVPLDAADGEAGAFARALSLERVRESEPLRIALRRARELPGASLEAASALARAGDPGSAGPLVAALLESCPACLSPENLAGLFGPLGEEGIVALARLAEATLPFGVSPLEALHELDEALASELAREAFAAALARGCVPEPLLPALLALGIDPFPDLLSALEARGCDRSRLRPGEPVAAGIARPPSTPAGQAARRALDLAGSGSCRTALASLLGIEAYDRKTEER